MIIAQFPKTTEELGPQFWERMEKEAKRANMLLVQPQKKGSKKSRRERADYTTNK